MPKNLIDVGAGRKKADLVIKNATVADVFNGVYMHGDVAVVGEIGRASCRERVLIQV